MAYQIDSIQSMEPHQGGQEDEGDDYYVGEEGSVEESEDVDDNRPPAFPTIHPDRCPSLDLKFMWRIYQKRNSTTAVSSPQDVLDDSRRKRRERMVALRDQGFPVGLASLMLDNTEKCPVRILLIDNGGTMNADDATMVTQSSTGKVQTTECTRWEALTSALTWHAEMAAWLQNPTVLRFMQDPGANVGPQQLGISSSSHYSSTEELNRMKQSFRSARPTGHSKICEHLEDVLASISDMVPTLLQEERRLMLCLLTDSIPYDEQGNFGQFLSMLRGWPVQVVIRLSTADERVFQFYRSLVQVFNVIPVSRPSIQPGESGEVEGLDEGRTLDSNTDHGGGDYNNNVNGDGDENDNDDDGDDGDNNEEGGSNVSGDHPNDNDRRQLVEETFQLMGDFMTELQRVYSHNPWLNYGFPLHLCREEGIGIHVVESLSQRPLKLGEALIVLGCIFGEDLRVRPCSTTRSTDPIAFRTLRSRVEQLNTDAGVLWSPLKKKVVPWVDMKKFNRTFLRGHGNNGGTGFGGLGGGSRMLILRGRSKRNHGQKSCSLM